MTETEIAAVVETQQSKSALLMSQLVAKGVSLDSPRRIDHQFWVRDFAAARRLADALAGRGYALRGITPPASDSDGDPWQVEVETFVSPRTETATGSLAALVRLADDHGGHYDGWGTEA